MPGSSTLIASLTPSGHVALSRIRPEPGLRSPALCHELGVSGSTVARYVKVLREWGLVRFEGPRSSGGYVAEEG